MSSRIRSRRQLLQTLTIGTGVAAFAPALRPWRVREAYAQPPSGPPKRIVFVFFPHGWPDPTDIATPGVSATDFKLGAIAQPLERHRRDLVILDNMEFKRPADQGFQHGVGRCMLWTGRPTLATDPGAAAKGISLDQYLGKVVGTKVTPGLPLLNQRLYDRVGQLLECSYNESGGVVPANANPHDVYNSVFRNLVVGGPPKSDPVADAASARKKSVLDAVAAEVNLFRKRLGPEDRIRADAQLEAIASMEAKVAGLQARGASCSKPLDNLAVPVPDPSTRSLPARADLQLSLLTAAFACDLTRIASYQVMGGQNLPCNFSPVSNSANWHSLSHGGNDNYASFRNAQRWVFSLVADLADRLKAIPEGAGTMLDNTIIAMGSEIGPRHVLHGLFLMSLGGKNLGIRVGQHLRFGDVRAFGRGQSHNPWLVSLMNAMGVPGDTFGDTTALAGRGSLPGYWSAPA